MVCCLDKYDLKIMCTHLDQKNPEVVFTLGSEARTFQLEGFINFWLDMFDTGRKAVDARLALTRSANSIGRHTTPAACGLKRHGLKIRFTHLNHVKPEVDVALGSELRTLQLEDFIDFWQEMKELLPKAAYVHLAYQEQLARQRRQRSRGASPSRESARERGNTQEPAVVEEGAGSVKAEKEPVWVISPDALAMHLDNRVVLLDIYKDLCYGLNDTASQIWLAMESSPSGITLEGIVRVLETHGKVSRQELETETAEHLSLLQGMGLVQCNWLH
jgi:hypothetical protein